MDKSIASILLIAGLISFIGLIVSCIPFVFASVPISKITGSELFGVALLILLTNFSFAFFYYYSRMRRNNHG